MILSLQLYSLRNFMDFDQSLQFCKDKGLSHVEPAGLYEHSPQQIVEKLQQFGLKAQSFHFSLELLEESWEQLGRILPACGAQDFVMPFANAETLAEVEDLALRLQNLALKLKDLGIRLHYHNHAHEIAKVFAGKCFLDQLLDFAPDLYWQADVGWVCAGGGDVPVKMKQWQERISMLHIKDILQKDSDASVQTKMLGGVEVVLSAAAQEGGQPARLGDGIVPFGDIFATAKKLGIETFILENDNPLDADAFADSGIELVKKYTA